MSKIFNEITRDLLTSSKFVFYLTENLGIGRFFYYVPTYELLFAEEDYIETGEIC